MKKVMVSTVLGIVSSTLAVLPLIALSSAAHAEIVRVERPVVVHPVGDGINHPVADADAIRISRENADDDNDGVTNVNDPDDDNDGVPDADENAGGDMGASSDVGVQQ